jgi:glycosyltransferase involved in cell wall biosynthesis
MSLRNVLMLAYVFPPFFSVGGSIRAVKFAKYLPACGWRPVVLTIDDRQETTSQRCEGSAALLNDIPPEARIYRTRSGEPSAQLQQKGRAARERSRLAAIVVNALSWLRRMSYRYVLLPDAHITWLPTALRHGRRIVREEQIEVIWATCPPHSTAVIAAALKWLTHRPLILDYRDDWIDTPWFRTKPRLSRWLERRLEQWAVHRADRVVCVTTASRAAFVTRYSHLPADKFVLIPNGCDLEDFAAARSSETPPHDTFNIVHAGLLSVDQGWHRSPEALFAALRNIARDQPDIGRRLRVTFTGHLPDLYRRSLADDALKQIVQEAGFLPHDQFVRLLCSADLLLTINYDGFGTLIPGKIYEYWAVGRAPILLLDGEGAAQRFVQAHSLGLCVQPDDIDGIASAILHVYRCREAGTPLRTDTTDLPRYDRKVLTRELASLLGQVSPAKKGSVWHMNWKAG